MNGLNSTKKKLGSLLCLGVVCAIGLGGCAGGSILPHTTSRAELAAMPADESLRQMESDVRSWENAGWITDLVSPNLKALAEAYANDLRSLNDDMKEEIKSSNTPAEALREMVEDVSSYTMNTFPRQAETLGIADYRLNVAMGDLINKNDDPRLYGALAMIKDNLVNNVVFANQFKLLAASKSKNEELIDSINGGNTAIFTNLGGVPDFIDPKYTFAIQGTSWITREGYLNHQLNVYTQVESQYVGDNEQTGSILIERKYFYHPIDGHFITEAENNRRAAMSK